MVKRRSVLFVLILARVYYCLREDNFGRLFWDRNSKSRLLWRSKQKVILWTHLHYSCVAVTVFFLLPKPCFGHPDMHYSSFFGPIPCFGHGTYCGIVFFFFLLIPHYSYDFLPIPCGGRAGKGDLGPWRTDKGVRPPIKRTRWVRALGVRIRTRIVCWQVYNVIFEFDLQIELNLLL